MVKRTDFTPPYVRIQPNTDPKRAMKSGFSNRKRQRAVLARVTALLSTMIGGVAWEPSGLRAILFKLGEPLSKMATASVSRICASSQTPVRASGCSVLPARISR